MNKQPDKNGINVIESKCFICDSEKAEIFTKKIRFDISKTVLKCANCGLIYLKPPFCNEETSEYYQNEYRKAYEAPSAEDYFNSQLEVSSQRLDFIKKHLKKEDSIIEIGSASGSFLATLKQNGFLNVSGIEPDRNYSEYAINSQNLNIIQNTFEDYDIPDETYDIILNYHVLEHSTNPVDFLKKSYDLLKPGGKLIFEIPNVDDYLISIFKSEPFKNFYFQPAHNFYFSPKTVSKALNKANFKKIQINQLQRYSYINGINWIKTGEPSGISGGKKLHLIQNIINFIFSFILKAIKKTDTLVIIATK